MNTTSIITNAMLSASVVLSISVVLFHLLAVLSRSGNPPGLKDGKLEVCSTNPNCVCSEAQSSAAFRTDPVPLPPTPASDLLPILKSAIKELGGTIKSESGAYIAAVFTSAIFGFKDDFEVRIDYFQKKLHIRSASRVGYSDTGVNRKRVESFKSLFYKKIEESG